MQEEAVKINYDALRYINSPTQLVELMAIKHNEQAIQFIHVLDKIKIIEFLKVNILVLKYVNKDITKMELIELLKEVLSRDDVEEKYIRDFLNYNTIENNIMNDVDKIMFLYTYGSKKAKKIAVDERLKLI